MSVEHQWFDWLIGDSKHDVHRNRRYGLLGTGRRGGGGGGGLAATLYGHQNDFCIRMGSDESHFNVSVGSDWWTN